MDRGISPEERSCRLGKVGSSHVEWSQRRTPGPSAASSTELRIKVGWMGGRGRGAMGRTILDVVAYADWLCIIEGHAADRGGSYKGVGATLSGPPLRCQQGSVSGS